MPSHRETHRYGRDASTIARLAIFAVALLACMVAGGSSRADMVNLLALRPILVICLIGMLLVPTRRDWRVVGAPLLLLGLWALTIIVQLVPLPWSIWSALPGHARFAEGLRLSGIAPAMHPISLAPDFTWNSLLALLPALVALLGFSSLDRDDRARFWPVLFAIAGLSAMLGILQLSTGVDSPLFPYTLSNRDYPIGFFANRNHEGVFLGAMFPALRAWTLAARHQARLGRRYVAIGGAAVLIVMVMLTGSRAGLIAAGAGIVAAGLIDIRRLRRARPIVWIGAGALLAAAAVLVATLLLNGKAVALNRLLATDDVSTDPRFAFLNTTSWQLTRLFFPFGSGFGTFDEVYRVFEPPVSLSGVYFHNAHNDLLETALTGGLPALIMLAIFLIWYIARTVAAFRMTPSSAVYRARAAALMGMIVMAASLVDYPLRTPLMGAVFALLCGWLAASRDEEPTRLHVKETVDNHPGSGLRRAKFT